jgi:hypothetical protein
MTMKELEARVTALEHTLDQIQNRIANGTGDLANPKQPWWITQAGSFANDPGFEEMVRLGREYRESLHPDYRKSKKKKATRSTKR